MENNIVDKSKGLPFYNYYLTLANDLIDESYLRFPNTEPLSSSFMDNQIQEIENAIENAIKNFSEEKDPNKKTQVKVNRFGVRRVRVENRLEDLKIWIEQKKLTKEME